MEKYAGPIIGDMRVDRISHEHVLRILSPIWTSRPEVARKLRQRIRATLRWCQAPLDLPPLRRFGNRWCDWAERLDSTRICALTGSRLVAPGGRVRRIVYGKHPQVFAALTTTRLTGLNA